VVDVEGEGGGREMGLEEESSVPSKWQHGQAVG